VGGAITVVALATTPSGAGATQPLCPLAAPSSVHIMMCGCSTSAKERKRMKNDSHANSAEEKVLRD